MGHPVDVHVGKRIRHRRWMMGRTQQELAQEVGIKFQQIQKYEAATNRVSASRLWDIAGALNVSVSYFFEGLSNSHETTEELEKLSNSELLKEKEARELIRSYYSIPESQRRRFFDLARVLGNPD